MSEEQLRLLGGHVVAAPGGSDAEPGRRLTAISEAFDPARLTQARRLAGRTKRAVAEAVRVSPAAVGQWESGAVAPRPDHVARLAELLEVPPGFLAIGRRYVRLDVGDAHFRSLRSTPAALRAKAIAFTEQVWELTHALETRVQLPPVDLPGFAGGEVQPGHYAGDPAAAAAELRRAWALGDGPIPHLVRTMERHGLIVTLVPFAGAATKTVDAFSTSHLPRPVVVLTPDRADDVYRHRFTAAHELGHLVLHGETAPGDPVQEKEADSFAAELLTPRASITPQLPARLDLHELERLGQTWGVGVESLVYRCHEVGTISDATYRRAFQRLNQLRQLGLFGQEPVGTYPGEIPALIGQAFDVAQQNGLTITALADELRITLPRLRLLLGQADQRPSLQLVP
jgi:Zn-dependent peptidase ImmA (M78 family)/transcriptional regulator with XRE-family HTH domain